MNKNKQITQTKIVNVIFLLYLNLIFPVVAIKQFDMDNHIHKNIHINIEKNIGDFFSRYKNELNTTFSITNASQIISSNSNLETNKKMAITAESTTNSNNINIKINEKLLPISSDNFLKKNNNNKIDHHISSFIQTSLSNKNDTNSQKENIDNPDEIKYRSNSLNTVDNSSAKNYTGDQKQELISNLNKTLNKANGSLLLNSSNRIAISDKLRQDPTPPHSQVNSTMSPLLKINATSSSPSRLNSSSTTPMKTNINYISPSQNSQNTTTNNRNITKSSCPNNCSGKGLCVNGNCFCLQGYTTEDCSMTYKDFINQGIKLQPNIKWIVILFFGVFGISSAILIWANCNSSKAGDHLELD